jgi:hypothetical protein
MHFVDNRNRLPPIPPQLKQNRKIFSAVFVHKVPWRADVASSRAIPEESNGTQIILGTKGTLDALWRITSNAKVVTRPGQVPRLTLHSITLFFFFLKKS